MLCNYSKLKEQDLDRIKSLESVLHHTLLAFSCQDAPPAKLGDEQLGKLQALEKDLGIVLVALES